MGRGDTLLSQRQSNFETVSKGPQTEQTNGNMTHEELKHAEIQEF